MTPRRPLCRHCRQPLTNGEIVDSFNAGMPGAYCVDCTHDGILSNECPNCNEVPGSRRADPCPDYA